MKRDAFLSACGLFRYRLSRVWDDALPLLVFVMLNPSTADALIDDHTVRKCIGFAKRLGYGGILIVNLFAYRATDPADLRAAGWQVGPDNDGHIIDAVTGPGRAVVCAWGAEARGLARVVDVLDLVATWADSPPLALKLTADGVPRHPLMLPYACSPLRFSCDRAESPRPK